VGLRACPDAVVKRKISSPRRESNLDHPIVQPVASRYLDDCNDLFYESAVVAFAWKTENRQGKERGLEISCKSNHIVNRTLDQGGNSVR
jgi:hypothetical protein